MIIDVMIIVMIIMNGKRIGNNKNNDNWYNDNDW